MHRVTLVLALMTACAVPRGAAAREPQSPQDRLLHELERHVQLANLLRELDLSEDAIQRRAATDDIDWTPAFEFESPAGRLLLTPQLAGPLSNFRVAIRLEDGRVLVEQRLSETRQLVVESHRPHQANLMVGAQSAARPVNSMNQITLPRLDRLRLVLPSRIAVTIHWVRGRASVLVRNGYRTFRVRSTPDGVVGEEVVEPPAPDPAPPLESPGDRRWDRVLPCFVVLEGEVLVRARGPRPPLGSKDSDFLPLPGPAMSCDDAFLAEDGLERDVLETLARMQYRQRLVLQAEESHAPDESLASLRSSLTREVEAADLLTKQRLAPAIRRIREQLANLARAARRERAERSREAQRRFMEDALEWDQLVGELSRISDQQEEQAP